MFRNAKVGDRVWDFRHEWGTIINMYPISKYPIEVKFDFNDIMEKYTVDGKEFDYCKNPTLFWDEIKFEIPKKPFDLKEFLKENLEPKEFVINEDNYYIKWYYSEKEFDYYYDFGKEELKQYFTRKNIDKVVEILNDNKITIEQLKQAFRELGWL